MVAAAALLAPAVASAQVTVSGFPVSPSLDAAPSGGHSRTQGAISAAPDGSAAEWFVVSGRRQDLLAITPTGRQSLVASGLASDAGAPADFTSIDADGYDWVLDNDQGPGNVLYAVGAAGSASPGLNVVAHFGDYGQDLTLGPDGALYAADNDGIVRCQITAAPSASCATVAIPPPFYTGAGAFAIAGGGNAVWFTDGIGELGAYSGDGFSGPYPSDPGVTASTDPGSITIAPNGYLYAAGGPPSWSGNNTEILKLSPGDPSEVQVAASGLGNVVALTVGPDGNLWFLDASSAGSIGQLNLATGQVTSYPLPSGLYLSPTTYSIANGPIVPGTRAEGELFFSATTSPDGLGDAAIGEVSGIPLAVAPGVLVFAPAVRVSTQRRAILTLTCNGHSGASCAGSIILTTHATVRRRVQVRGSKNGNRAQYRTIEQTRQLALGAVNYDVGGGQSVRTPLTLSRAAYRLLEAVAGHTLKVKVTGSATVGTVTGRQLTITGPGPKRGVRLDSRR